jgi:hypothetical protein
MANWRMERQHMEELEKTSETRTQDEKRDHNLQECRDRFGV